MLGDNQNNLYGYGSTALGQLGRIDNTNINNNINSKSNNKKEEGKYIYDVDSYRMSV